MQERAQTTRHRLMDAAIDSIYRHGFADTTTSKIGEIADVSAAAIHHHFDGKDDLMARSLARLMSQLHADALAGCRAAASPRGRIAAVIESVLGWEQSDERACRVWLSFWVYADHSEPMRRLKNLYSRRLRSNLIFYCRPLFRGSDNAESRAGYAANGLMAMMHGAWLSFTLKENALDLSRARMLVSDYLDLLIAAEKDR